MTKNAYIHIPFCKSKCHYCSFVSFNKLELIEPYINSLLTQIKSEYKNENIETLYIGGGTPSLLSIDYLKRIINEFKFASNPEITIEVNPNDVNADYLKSLLDLGINRLSIGIQTFDDEILRLINRRHNSNEAKSSIGCALDCGFENISIDFIYGLINQNINKFISDLQIAMNYPIKHISLYGLKIDSDCYFYNNMPSNVPDDDEQADMYIKAVEILSKSGFEHYEVSNFAKKNYYSKHNLNYWDAETYYGFGCSASGYTTGRRYTNIANLENYINSPLEKISITELSKQEMLEETIFLGLRKSSGIDINLINNKFGIDFEKKYANVLSKYDKYFRKTNIGYTFNLDGILISNVILSEFLS